LKEEFGATSDSSLSAAYTKLAEQIHPLVLGDVYRTQKQIQMLAQKMLEISYSNKKQIKKIVSFLCSDSGSHDYTINRTEAKALGLNVESPTPEIYAQLKDWYYDVVKELELKTPYDPNKVLGTQSNASYQFKRCLIESIDYGQDAFVSEGILSKAAMNVHNNQQFVISNNVIFEGWKHL